jgi:hypothetical protein
MDAAESQELATQESAATQELARLRRELRALSLVNRQLHAQLEGGVVRLSGAATNAARGALSVRRTAEGGAWLEHLHLHGGGEPMLVRTPTQGVYVVEGHMRRPVRSGLLFAALTRVLDAPKDMTDRDVERWSLGPPVEVLEAGTGAAFLVVGGRRLPLRGLPLPYLVSTNDMLLFPEGQELNVAAPRAAVPKRSSRARDVIAKDGVVRGGAKLARKAARRVASTTSPPPKASPPS